METELKDCGDNFKKRNTKIKKKTLVKCEELRRGHQLKQVELLEVEVNDIQHGHITRAFDRDGVTKCICCGRAGLRRDFPRFCGEAYTMSNKRSEQKRFPEPSHE